ncbi:PadR family transcriptional regulator [Nonomuraea endophytica]|uniref:DNA-binding PadR family transcriptional regulator n=1 Tax=Nonomuraea endophytica TaxID=714136 RepID=A0A7W8A2B6_9ACTN|nr:PadR family transcriptional regulator [Nonomuraea endophytica]MBB5077511.1 DNA-binding PadR family transcriptional regulator [Nonomuraea endophytica]
MPSEVRLTTTVATVLRIFLEDVSEPRYGFELMKHAKVQSGTLYPILARLEAAGWIEGRREVVDARHEGRPPRRLYLLTGGGATAARQALAELSARLTPPPPRGAVRPEGGYA